MRWGQRTKRQRSNNPLNWRSSAWFKSETAEYFIPLFVHVTILYPRRVTTVAEIVRLVGAGVMKRLIGCLFRW